MRAKNFEKLFPKLNKIATIRAMKKRKSMLAPPWTGHRDFGGLKRPRLMSFRVDDIEYEYIVRRCYKKSIADETRRLWLNSGWEKELEKLRYEQRKAKLPDHRFLHPHALRGLPAGR